MKCVGKTDVGIKRKNNQDSYAVINKNEYLLAVVCDGMGGARGGNVASDTAVRTFCKAVRESFALQPAEGYDGQEIEDLLKEAVSEANAEVYRRATEDSDLEGMGTTLVAVLLCDAGQFAVNVGDSRLYVQNGETFAPLTKDNSFIQYLLDKGLVTPEEALVHPNRNIILRALGVNEEVEIDLYRIPPFERLLLCSDGLYNMLSQDEMNGIVDGSYNGKRRLAGFRTRIAELIKRANQNGGTDNITAVLIGNN